MSLFDLVTAQEVQVEPGRANTIDLVAAAGVSQDALRDRVDTTLPSTFEVISGEGLTEESRNEVADALSFLNTFMLIFAAIALFVASLIIFDTFSILVAQRSKELGLLRALGASRRQVLGSVLLEAVIVGVIASIVGLLGGLGWRRSSSRSWPPLASRSRPGRSPSRSERGAWRYSSVLVQPRSRRWVAGVLAATLPARRAAKLDILRAIGG